MKTSHWVLLGAFAWLVWLAVRRLGTIQVAVAGVAGRLNDLGETVNSIQQQLNQPKETPEPRKET